MAGSKTMPYSGFIDCGRQIVKKVRGDVDIYRLYRLGVYIYCVYTCRCMSVRMVSVSCLSLSVAVSESPPPLSLLCL